MWSFTTSEFQPLTVVRSMVTQLKTGMGSGCLNASEHRCSPPISQPSSQVSLSLSLSHTFVTPFTDSVTAQLDCTTLACPAPVSSTRCCKICQTKYARAHAHACNTAQRECEFIHAFVLILVVSQLEQSIIHLIDHPEIEVRTALLPLLCSHRFDFSDDVLLVPTLRPLPFALC